jgi:hypothetical protein
VAVGRVGHGVGFLLSFLRSLVVWFRNTAERSEVGCDKGAC